MRNSYCQSIKVLTPEIHIILPNEFVGMDVEVLVTKKKTKDKKGQNVAKKEVPKVIQFINTLKEREVLASESDRLTLESLGIDPDNYSISDLKGKLKLSDGELKKTLEELDDMRNEWER